MISSFAVVNIKKVYTTTNGFATSFSANLHFKNLRLFTHQKDK